MNRSKMLRRQLPNADYALEFDGVDDYVDLPKLGFSGDVTITMEAWVDPASVQKGTIVGFGALSSNNSCVLRFDDNSEVYGYKFYFYANDLNAISNYGSDYDTQGYIHIAAVYDAANSSRYIYEDGALIGSDNPSNVSFINTSYKIGEKNDEHLDGDISDLRIWNTARTQTEIQDNMNKKLTGTETGLVAYYKLDEGKGCTTADSSGNGNAGTLEPNCPTNSPNWIQK